MLAHWLDYAAGAVLGFLAITTVLVLLVLKIAKDLSRLWLAAASLTAMLSLPACAAKGPTAQELHDHAANLDTVRDGIACESTLSPTAKANLLLTATLEAENAHRMEDMANGH